MMGQTLVSLQLLLVQQAQFSFQIAEFVKLVFLRVKPALQEIQILV